MQSIIELQDKSIGQEHGTKNVKFKGWASDGPVMFCFESRLFTPHSELINKPIMFFRLPYLFPYCPDED
jgi:hypothetical protein